MAGLRLRPASAAPVRGLCARLPRWPLPAPHQQTHPRATARPDDFGTHSLTDQQRFHLFEIVEERYRRKSTIITAWAPVARWHDVADAILDRIVHNVHRIVLQGDSMRSKRPRLS
ncbi:ATP-binding protein [Mesorhizobium sp. M1163]|uniref:ATP-binding protein n=1 Tax=Mesorhizobium sp. M1163 TaxID=2957065 RepID=UPI00333DFAE6